MCRHSFQYQSTNPFLAQSDVYRYGFNGEENENNIDHDFWAYSQRVLNALLGRWMSLDPLYFKYPDESAYSFGMNSPIEWSDDGGYEIKPSRKSTTHSGPIMNIHSLAFCRFDGISFEHDPVKNEINILVNTTISTHQMLGLAFKESLEAENQGLTSEIMAHETSHEDQYVDAVKMTKVTIQHRGKNYKAPIDEVLTSVLRDHQKALQSEVKKLSEQGYFKNQNELDQFILQKNTAFNKEINNLFVTASAQVYEKFSENCSKERIGPDRVQEVEDDANARAFIKLKGKAVYLNNKKEVMHKGKPLRNAVKTMGVDK